MRTPEHECSEEWRFSDEPPVVACDERIVLSSPEFDESFVGVPDRDIPRVLLVGHSRDPDLARIATLLANAGTAVEVLLVDRIGGLPSLELPGPQLRRYDVGYCRGFRPDQQIHYHFDRTLRRSADWRRIDPARTANVTEQAECLLWRWLTELKVGRWVNSPWQLRDAENKLTQMALAHQAGMSIPATLVTTSLVELRQFSARFPRGIIHKSLASPIVHSQDGIARFLYTSPVSVDAIEALTHPTLFQERLDPVTEHRVTIVGRRTFTASLTRHPGAQTDWRRRADDHQQFEHGRLPSVVTEQLHTLMDALHIEVGAADVIETIDGFYFLEINPSAALLWLERSLGMQLGQSVTNLVLCGG